MIYLTGRIRLFILVSCSFYACQQNDLLAPPPKPVLPVCSNNVVQGYTDKTSYWPGEVASVFLQSSTNIQCGLGFYDPKGKLIFSADVSLYSQTIAQIEPWLYGYNYAIHSEIHLPQILLSGVYYIEKKIPIVIKSPMPASVTVVFPSNTINAYNSCGGKSLYGFNSTNGVGSSVVSFLRPMFEQSEEERCNECLKWFSSLPDFSFKYISDIDMDNYASFSGSKVLVIAGHSEYWTRAARNNFDRFVEEGKHVVLLSGNSMWWQVRYSNDHNQLICYRDFGQDPESDPLLKTVRWVDPVLNFPITRSIGSDFDHGGYGLKPDNGWNGFKIVNAASPLLEGLSLHRGDIISVPSDECDGALINGFDADGFPLLDNKHNFAKYELIGFDRGSRGGAETYPTFIAMRATASSGIIINMGSSDWCSQSGVGSTSGNPLKTITKNAIRKLLDGSNVFSD